MLSVLERAGCFVAVILMGYLLRRVHFFEKEDFKVISKIVIRITLTASIVVNFSGQTLDYSTLILIPVAFCFGILMMATGYLLGRVKGREEAAFGLLNSSGCNIGNFVIPFAQSFLSPASVMAVSLFDTGNSPICLGGAYSVARSVRDTEHRFSVKPILRTLAHSAPLIAYVAMTLLGIFRITLPSPAVNLARIIGNANPFLAMLMLGVGFELTADRTRIGTVLRILLPRYGIGLALSVCSYLFLPLALPVRQALAILFLSPVSSAAPAFTAEMKGDYGLASAVNSLSILISIVLIVTALILIS